MRLSQCSLLLVYIASSSVTALSTSFVITGGTGRIGTAVATHLLKQQRHNDSTRIILAGRNPEKGQQAVNEVLRACSSTENHPSVEWQYVEDVWDFSKVLPLADQADCFIHTAGPYLNQQPVPLQAAIASTRCKAYVDVSDPLDYLDASLKLSNEAADSQTTCLLCAGAFPGMSNVLAMEAASCIDGRVRDLRFNYFTAGLGGSGSVNLEITNLGFGEPQAQFEKGNLRLYKNLSGRLLGKVDFYLQDEEKSTAAQERIGRQTVFAWPFPESATVARELAISGDSSAAMGTAPDVWNTMLGMLVDIVPRKWWKFAKFSKFLANFSEPLVKLTDAFLQETHGMRVDVVGENDKSVSIVQAHESFRTCVGQSCAEFALDLISFPGKGGVQLPEQRYRDDTARRRIISKLTSTPGTLSYTGPVTVSEAPAPSDLDRALQQANKAEMA